MGNPSSKNSHNLFENVHTKNLGHMLLCLVQNVRNIIFAKVSKNVLCKTTFLIRELKFIKFGRIMFAGRVFFCSFLLNGEMFSNFKLKFPKFRLFAILNILTCKPCSNAYFKKEVKHKVRK